MTGILRVCYKCKKKKDINKFFGVSSVCRQCKRLLVLRDRPIFRKIEIIDGENYHNDIKLLWVAHQRKPFYSIKSDTQEGFVNEILSICNTAEVLIAEDFNSEYEDKGPLAVVCVFSDQWQIQPHVEFFKWASKRNILRITISFLTMTRNRPVGVCKIWSLENSKSLFDHCVKLGLLYFVGKVVNGDIRGDEYLYSLSNFSYAKEHRCLTN